MANLQVMQGITAGSTTSGGSSGVAFPLQVSSTDDYGVGTTRWNSDGTKQYKWVKVLQTASQTIAAGDVLVYVTTTGYGAGVAVVSSDASADGGSVPIGAGVCTAAITAAQGTTGAFVWIQITGDCTLSNSVSSGAAGKEVTASTTDKVAVLRANAYDSKLGTLYNTTTGVILDCLV